MSPPVETLRRVAWVLQFAGVLVSAAVLLGRWIDWGGLAREEIGGLVGLLGWLWSPYVALGGATWWLGRSRLRLAVLCVASLVVLAWDVYWRLDALAFHPDPVAEVMAPVLITGNQWIAVVVAVLTTAVLPDRSHR